MMQDHRMAARTRIVTDVDYDKYGKQVGWLYLPHSVTRSAYGHIAIPVAVVKNGAGPTIFLMAGNHGDEYEGQIALCKLIRSIDPGRVQGRIIVMPAANLPAALAGARVSPIDQGNLNRAFPGDPDGTPTQQIAWYIDQVIFPMSRFHHDIHSGGTSLDYLPFVSMRKSGDADLDARAMAALKAYAAPDALVWGHSHDVGLAAQAAIGRAVVALGGEFGGRGAVSRAGVAIVERGLRNLLAHAGIVAADKADSPPAGTRLWEVASRDYYALAPDAGLFEPAVSLGDQVEAGHLCGHVHFVDNPAREPVPAHFSRAGMVICRRHPGRVERGDCVAHLATAWQG
jgi:predicted deacylase